MRYWSCKRENKAVFFLGLPRSTTYRAKGILAERDWKYFQMPRDDGENKQPAGDNASPVLGGGGQRSRVKVSLEPMKVSQE